MLGTSKNIWGFDPRSVPGCALWLDGADSNSMTLSGSNVTAWTDKSPLATAFTLSNGSGGSTIRTTYTGLPVVQVSNSCFFNASYSYPLATRSIFFVMAETVHSDWRGLLSFASNAAQSDYNTQNGYTITATNTVGANVQFSQNLGNGGFHFNYNASNGVKDVPFQLYEDVTSNTAVTLFITGSNVYSSNTSVTPLTSIGLTVGGRNGIPNSGALVIAEVLLYNTALTTSQRQQVEGYLAHKWGLTGYYDSSIPLSIPGCQLWLDAADSSTVTGTTTVTQWRDKSRNARHLGVGSGTTSYSSNAIQLTNSYMFVTSPVDLSKVTVFIVAKTTGGNNQTVFSARPNSAFSWNSLDGFGFYMDSQTSIRFYGLFDNRSQFNVNTSTPQVFSFQSIGTSVSGWYNGVSQSGGTLTSPRTSTAQGFAIGGEWHRDQNEYINFVANASLYEIIVYNSDVSTAQRQTIEGYLARKWGLTSVYPSIPSTHPFSSIRPHLRTFQPTDVPGCQLWLDGADQGSMTLSGSSVTQWRDKSGRGFNVATSSGATAPLYNSSTKELQFVSGNSNSFTIPQAFGDALVGTTFSFFFIGRRTVNTTYVYFLSGATSGGNQNLFIGFLSNKMEIGEYGPYASADIPTFNSPDPMRLYYYDIQSSTTANLIMNGNPLSTTVSGNLFLTSFAQPELGRRYGGAVYHDFNLSEMVVFSPALNTSQRQQVEGYLAHKWGLNTTYGTNTPLLIPGCQLWLDAADSSTITGTTSITAWRDKSGRGNNAVFTGTNPSYVAASNVVITANLNQGFTVPAATIQQTTGSGSIFLVYGDQQTQGSSYAALFSSPLPAQSFCQSLKRPDSYSYQFNNSTSPVLATVVNALNTTNTIIYTMNYTYNSTTGSIRVNGTTCASSFNSSPTPSGALTISSSGWGDGANVRLYEIITFVNVVPLTTVQQQQIEGYLAKKWGLTVSGQFLSTHPFRSIPPAILPFSPRNITGLSLWLDAADQGSMTLSGSNVTQWNDKSGNEKHATAGGTTPTYSSATRSIVFGGAGYFTNSSLSLPLSTRSVFIVCKQTSRAADFEGIMLLSSPSDGSIDYDSSTTIPYFASGSNVVVGDTAFSIYNRGTYVQNYRPYVLTPLGIYTDVFGSSSGTLYVNGTSNSTVADSSGLGTANGYILGARKFSGTTLSTFLNGTINEILVYNTALTTSQRQQVEGYLAWKWGLTPSYSSTTPLSIPGCQLWLDAADTSTLVLSGSNVTQWNDKSGNGNNGTANTPVALNSAINNLPALTFTTSEYIGGNISITGNTLTVFSTFKVSSLPQFGRVISLASLGGNDYNNTSSTGILNYGSAAMGPMRVSQYVSSATPLNTSVVHTVYFDGTNAYVYTNGGTPSSMSSSGDFSVSRYNLGRSTNTGDTYSAFSGFIGEVIIYNTLLTTTQRQSIEGYLARKWGFTSMYSALPSIHPYVKFPPA